MTRDGQPLGCPGCPMARKRAERYRGTMVLCRDCGEGITIGDPMPPQRFAPPVATLAPVPDRNRRVRTRVWRLIPDMALLARHFAAIEGRAQSIEPSVQNGGARDENDKRDRERATAVLIHARLCSLPGTHRAVIDYLLIKRDGSKLGDDDERTSPAAAKARETAFERCAVAFASKGQREAWQRSRTRSVTQSAMRKIGRRLFEAARAAYENDTAD